MAKILSIKDANTPMKTVGDIIGTYEDDYPFSDRALEAYNVTQIMGTKTEVDDKLRSFEYLIERIYKSSSPANRWTFSIEKQEAWQGRDEKWYHFDIQMKYRYSLSGLDVVDITILETVESGLSRDVVFQKMIVNPGEWNVANAVEIKELN